MGTQNEMKYESLNKGFKIAALSMAVAMAAGCGSPSDPDAGGAISKTSVSGAAIDGYLAGATVYADLNNDGLKNAGEPSATTDGEGFFSTAKDGTDYCATAGYEKFCLQVKGTVPDSVVLRTFGGFDVFTGEPFVGELAASVSPEADGSIPDQLITPLSSVMLGAGTNVLGNLGLNTSQLESDFLDASSFDAEATNRAYLLHKIAVIFAQVFEDQYDYFGDESFFPSGASSFIYEAFATQLNSSSNINRAMLIAVFNAVDTKIIDTYNDNRSEGSSSISSNISTPEQTAAIDNAEDIIGLVNAAVPNDPSLTATNARARMMGVEMVVSKMINGSGTSDIADALAAAIDTSGAAGTLYDALGDGSDIDFTSLLNVDYSAGSIDYSSIDVTGGVSFDDLSGKELYVEYSDNEAGVSGAAVVLFEAPEAGSMITDSGALKLCIRYQDTTEDNELETEGALFDVGEWNKIDSRRLIVSVLGGFDFTLISRGAVGANNVFSLSYTGETRTWQTDQDLEDLQTSTAAMETHDDCKARLNPPT